MGLSFGSEPSALGCECGIKNSKRNMRLGPGKPSDINVSHMADERKGEEVEKRGEGETYSEQQRQVGCIRKIHRRTSDP